MATGWQATKNEVRLYRVDDRWVVRLEVTGKMLRGGGRALPGGVGSAIGCQPGGTRSFRTSVGRIVVSWTGERASGPCLGSIDQDLRAIDAREGDFVFLGFTADEVAVSLLRAEELRSLKPSVMVARLVGLPAEIANRAEPWRAIGTAVGIPVCQFRVTSSDVYASLMRRGEESLAKVVRKATADGEVNILDQLEGILGL